MAIAAWATQAEILKRALSANGTGNDVIHLKNNAHESFFAQTISTPALRQKQNFPAQTCWNAGATQLADPILREVENR